VNILDSRRLRCIIALAFATCLTGASPVLADVPDSVRTMVQKNCLDCHEGSEAEGGLDLSSLDADLSDSDTLQRWIRVVDRVRDGEMPPEDYGALSADDAQSLVAESGRWIRRWQQREHDQRGRVRTRRLTKGQLERTLHDLLAIDAPLASLIPDEPRTGGFTGIAAGQPMSHFQLESHLAVVDAALDAAFDRVMDSPETVSNSFTARDIARRNPRQRCRDPEMLDGLAVTWSSRLIFYGRITSTTVRESGWYRVTFTASAVNKSRTAWCVVHGTHRPV